MDLLEQYHEHPPLNDHFILRKTTIPSQGDVNLFGARGCGKTALILDYLQQQDTHTLYIDLEDPNLILTTLDTLPLQAYIEEYSITTLILDHYEEGMLDTFPIVDRLIVVSRIPLQQKHFTPLHLFPLDYEEFIAFEPAASGTVAFNHFLKTGTLPAMARHTKSTALPMKQFFQQQFSPNEQSLILMLARYNAQPMTIHQIYSFTKEYFRISKDFVYSAIKRFEQEGLLYFIDNGIKRSGKKMILYDFAFVKYLTASQPFGTQFDTMIALTLIKHGIKFKTLGVHGYLTDTGELIIPAPFDSEEGFWVKAQNKFSLFKKYGINKVTIVSVANSYDFSIEQMFFEAIPFNEWSIAHAEEETY
jgi:predicted AAA+ superfamily ATPase